MTCVCVCVTNRHPHDGVTELDDHNTCVRGGSEPRNRLPSCAVRGGHTEDMHLPEAADKPVHLPHPCTLLCVLMFGVSCTKD